MPRIIARTSAFSDRHRHRDRRRRAQGLVDDAVALRELEQCRALLFGEVAVDLEGETDIAEADRRALIHAEGALEIEIALGLDGGVIDLELESGGDRVHRHAGAGDQRLQQHVARAGVDAAAAGGGMKAGFDEGLRGLDGAGHAFADRALGLQGDHGAFRIVTVLRLDRGLGFLELG
jgi:hypothetical protein